MGNFYGLQVNNLLAVSPRTVLPANDWGDAVQLSQCMRHAEGAAVADARRPLAEHHFRLSSSGIAPSAEKRSAAQMRTECANRSAHKSVLGPSLHSNPKSVEVCQSPAGNGRTGL